MHRFSAKSVTMLGFGVWVAVGVALGLGGCGNLGINYAPGAKSLLEFNTGPNYEQASLRARNPYDANARYQGTLTLANAPFASEDTFLTLFEEGFW